MSALSNVASYVFTAVPKPNKRHYQIVSALLKRNMAIAGLVLLLGLIIASIFAPLIAPYDPTHIDYEQAQQGPSLEHPLGTDSFGRDILSRVIYGSRVSIYVGVSIVVLSLLGGVPIGLIAGYKSNTKLDPILMRAMDGLLSFPGLVLALTIMSILGGSVNNVILAFTIINIPIFARITRGSTLSVKEEEYIMSAKAAGSSDTKIIFSHILPNISAPIIVQATLVFAFAILNEATLSFLGVGTQPPTPSWGLMLQEGKQYLNSAPWIAFVPGIAIMISVLSLNFLGDALRDVLDPKYTEERLE